MKFDIQESALKFVDGIQICLARKNINLFAGSGSSNKIFVCNVKKLLRTATHSTSTFMNSSIKLKKKYFLNS
jgi:hypothetical protein